MATAYPSGIAISSWEDAESASSVKMNFVDPYIGISDSCLFSPAISVAIPPLFVSAQMEFS